jgi:mono/diheme cytochrome c family protein
VHQCGGASAKHSVLKEDVPMRPFPFLPTMLLTLLGATAQAQVQTMPATRGALLYENHCGACHSEQMHWRDKRLARDWNTLRAFVRLWQGEARLGWSEEDIDAVARHLNDTIYRYPAPEGLARHGP